MEIVDDYSAHYPYILDTCDHSDRSNHSISLLALLALV